MIKYREGGTSGQPYLRVRGISCKREMMFREKVPMEEVFVAKSIYREMEKERYGDGLIAFSFSLCYNE